MHINNTRQAVEVLGEKGSDVIPADIRDGLKDGFYIQREVWRSFLSFRRYTHMHSLQ